MDNQRHADYGRRSKSLVDWIREWADHPDVREWPVDTEGWPQYDDSRNGSFGDDS